jgi:hypothetical protein
MDHSNNFIQTPFAPLGKVYCDYFFYLTVINFMLFIYIVVSAIYVFFFDKKKENVFQIVLVALPTFVAYFTNRLLYSMCIGSTTM